MVSGNVVKSESRTSFTADIADAKAKIQQLSKEYRKLAKAAAEGQRVKTKQNQVKKDLNNQENKVRALKKQEAVQSGIDKAANKQATQTKKVVDKDKLMPNPIASMRQQMALQGLTPRQQEKGVGSFKQRMAKEGATFGPEGDVMDKAGKKIMGFNSAVGSASRSGLPKFHASLLSVLFLAQGVSATFGGMIKRTLQATGIFDAFAGILSGILLPTLIPIVTWLLKMFSALSENQGMKDFVAYAIIFLAVIAPIIGMIAQIGLLVGSIGAGALPVIGGVLVVILGLFIAVWSIIQLIEAITTGDWLKGLQALSGVVLGISIIMAGIAIAMGVAISPILIIVAAIAAIVAGVMFLIRNAKKIGNFVTGNGWTGDVIGAPKVAMASGGIVTRPTNALIGEAGPEAVIPLSKNGESNLGTTINYNPKIEISQSSGSSFNAANIAKEINSALHDDLRNRF